MDLKTAPPSALYKRIKSLEKRKSALDFEMGCVQGELAFRRDGLTGCRKFVLLGFVHNDGNLLNCIRNLRMATNMGLRDAKEMVEQVRDKKNPLLEMSWGPISREGAKILTETFIVQAIR